MLSGKLPYNAPRLEVEELTGAESNLPPSTRHWDHNGQYMVESIGMYKVFLVLRRPGEAP
ncbi:hypothetical protein KIPB_014042, partial [Kipferlia bialata]|eukprot:g14042.t1